ncbi:hypothetical protein NDU88_003227 [Pleurodeles waltl]|uniref:Uncharacterized protein n=1 Tax=Pleurodeles waltl TaxID=8319 RepID=A0AAV7SDX8_PLEWA|nr:hypothetical protein NDU88_003227 [Pleurodeles waltl]
MDLPRRGESCRSVFLKKDRKQALLAASRAVRVFGCCCGPGGTRMSPIASGDRGGAQQDKEAGSTRRNAGTGTTKRSETVLTRSCTKESHAAGVNLGGGAMQVRVPWTQAWLCTKDFRQKCTEAGVAAKVAVPSNAVWRGKARTYLHQTWTEESLDYGSHLERVAGFKGPRSSC